MRSIAIPLQLWMPYVWEQNKIQTSYLSQDPFLDDELFLMLKYLQITFTFLYYPVIEMVNMILLRVEIAVRFL